MMKRWVCWRYFRLMVDRGDRKGKIIVKRSVYNIIGVDRMLVFWG
jgi:hypothetical protein